MALIHQLVPLRISVIGGTLEAHNGEDFRATYRSAKANFLYTVRINGEDERGPTPDFAAKSADLVDHGREAPTRGPGPSLEGVALWEAADRAARDHCPQHATAFHLIGTLPPDGDPASWRALIQNFCQTEFCMNGMIADWAIHALADDAGSWKIAPHVHIILTARGWRSGGGRRPGQRNIAWLSRETQHRALRQSWSDTTGIYPASYSTAA